MTLTRHWNTPKIGEEQCLCSECGWSGKISDCNPRLDEIVMCPKCGHWVERRDPPEDNTEGRSR